MATQEEKTVDEKIKELRAYWEKAEQLINEEFEDAGLKEGVIYPDDICYDENGETNSIGMSIEGLDFEFYFKLRPKEERHKNREESIQRLIDHFKKRECPKCHREMYYHDGKTLTCKFCNPQT